MTAHHNFFIILKCLGGPDGDPWRAGFWPAGRMLDKPDLCGCMDGWMNGWKVGWMDGWVHEWVNGWMVGWLDRYVDGWVCGWMNAVPGQFGADNSARQFVSDNPAQSIY